MRRSTILFGDGEKKASRKECYTEKQLRLYYTVLRIPARYNKNGI